MSVAGKPEIPSLNAVSLGAASLPEGAYYYCAPRTYLRSMLAIVRSSRKREYLVVILRSGRFIRTDRLGILVAQALIDGRSGAEAIGIADRIEPGSGERAQQLICMLGAKGAMTLWPPGVSDPRRRLAQLISRVISLILNLVLLMVRVVPASVLASGFRVLSGPLIGQHVWRSSRSTILHNLRTSDYGDRSERWLQQIGRRVVDTSSNSLFNYLSLSLPQDRLNRVVEHLFDADSVDRLADQVQANGAMIGVFLHGPLCMALPNALGARKHEVLRTVVSWQHGINVSEASGPLSFFFGDSPEMTVDVAHPLATAVLLGHIQAGHTVYLGLDTWGKGSTATVEMLGHSFPRNDGPAWLAVRSQCPIALWTTHGSPSGVVVTASPLVYPNTALPVVARVEDLSRRLYAYAEDAVRDHPEAWMGWRTGPSATSSDTYNYRNFSFSLEERELASWLEFGPHVGEPAPDFRLDVLHRNSVQLTELRGRPVVLEFGSYTCRAFPDCVSEMERLARQHPDAEFLVIAVREAHPGELSPPHETLTQKQLAAGRLATEEGLGRRVVVDDLEGTVHRAYGGAWNSVYVIDANGCVGYRRAFNRPSEVAQALESLENGRPLPTGESVERPEIAERTPMLLLERGGRTALVDVYRGAPRPQRRRLRKSTYEAVRAVLRDTKAMKFP